MKYRKLISLLVYKSDITFITMVHQFLTIILIAIAALHVCINRTQVTMFTCCGCGKLCYAVIQNVQINYKNGINI